MSEKRSIIVALDRYTEKTIAHSGTMSRVHFALGRRPRGLTLEEIADITGLASSTIRIHGLRNLFNFQMVKKVEEDRGTVYRLQQADISVASPEREGARSLEDIRRR